jgi:DNA-directed RNA polymerase subunit RPC12/RpoP
MEKVHDYNFCPSCGSKLEGDEKLCPFCAYRLIEPSKPVVESPPVIEENKAFDGVYCPTCNSKIPAGQVVCSFCGFRIDGSVGLNDPNKIVQKNIGKASDEPKIPVAEVPVEKSQVHLHSEPEPVSESPRMEAPPLITEQTLNTTTATKSSLKRILIIVAGVVIVLGVVAGLFLSGILPNPLRKSIPATQQGVNHAAVSKTYYFCYASAVVKGKNEAAVSNVFFQTTQGNSTETAKAAFVKLLKIRYPSAYSSFSTVVCKSGTDINQLATEKDKVTKDYSGKKYKITFIEIH